IATISSDISAKPDKISLPSLSQQPIMPEQPPGEAQQQVRLDLLEAEALDSSKTSSLNSVQTDISAQRLQQELKKSLSEMLYIKQKEIDPDEQFIDMGMDSIIGVEWIRALNEQYGISIAVTKIYDYPNISKLAVFLEKELSKHRQVHPEQSKKERAGKSEAASTVQSVPRHSAVLSHKSNKTLFDDTDSSIAVIGISGQFPEANTLAQFWDNLAHGKDCISEIPDTRWSISEYYHPDPHISGKTYSKWMGVLENADRFDPLFFNISPAEAQLMDPQQRLFLENCWACIEDAGLNPALLSESLCGVFVGCGSGDYGQSMSAQRLNAQGLVGGSTSILSARISYFLDLQGPCMAIDTACSSSLVAMAQACDSLLFQRSNLALAGGVCVLTGPSMHIMTSKAGMLSKDGRCFTFDGRANGFVPGEGVGVMLLKRLSDAVREHDHIYGVIRGWGINQDGRTNGITAPSVNSQIALEKRVYQRFGIHPETISLVEAHG
ncbi:MAG: polyketide synthase, partial [bacterium]|nr:polyketide synthase [bacterium]